MQFDKSTRELVNEAADELVQQGINPTVDRIRAYIGRGSDTTIYDELRKWKRKQGSTPALPGESSMPKFMLDANKALLEKAEVAAMEKFSEERAGYCNEIDSLRVALEQAQLAQGELIAEIAALRTDLNERNAALLDAQNELIRLRAENTTLADGLSLARADVAAKDAELASKAQEYIAGLADAEYRLRSIEKNMLMHIDKARSDAKEALAYADRKASECSFEIERARRMSSEVRASMQEKNDSLNVEIGRLHGLLESHKERASVNRKKHRPARSVRVHVKRRAV